MLKIDCLLKNTESAETVRRLIGYLGNKRIAEGKDASFRSIYNELRKNGIEVDLESAASIYGRELPIEKDVRFTKEEDLLAETTAWHKKLVRALVLKEPKKGEQQIGELAPSKAVAKVLTDAFNSNTTSDLRTKSVMKQMEEIALAGANRLLGELPNKPDGTPPKVEDVIASIIEREQLGYRNTADGTINGVKKLFDSMQAELKSLTKELEADGDQFSIDQWKEYINNLETATYSFLLSKTEAKVLLDSALADAGFMKVSKNGKLVRDWKKMAGQLNDYQQLKDNVVNSLVSKGVDADIADRIGISMTKEFEEIRGRVVEANMRQKQKVEDTWTASTVGNKKTVKEVVESAVSEHENRSKMPEFAGEELKFSKYATKRIIAEALKENDEYGKDFGVDKRVIDWVAMSGRMPDAAMLRDMIVEYLESEKVDAAKIDAVADAIVRDGYPLLEVEVPERASAILQSKTDSLQKDRARSLSELERLANLNDLGIFSGQYNELLAKTLGLETKDVEAMQSIASLADQMSRLRNIMSGNEFIAATIQREIARDIQNIISSTIENKTKLLKAVSTINKIYQVENSALVAGYRNLIENHLSGLIGYATTKINARIKLGKELGGSQKELRKLMLDTWNVVGKGGVEVGLPPWEVGGTQTRVSDKYNVFQMQGQDWTKPKTWMKGTASALLSVPRMFLQGTDGMFKIGNYRLQMLMSLQDALVNTGNFTKEEARSYLNEAFYDQTMIDNARRQAERIYQETGVKVYSKKQINLLANDLLAQNLLTDGGLDAKSLREVMESSFNMAGLEMGHESNNKISTLLQSSKIKLQHQEMKAFSEGRYRDAAGAKMWNTAINSIFLRFAASQFNWAWIKLEQSGLGLASSLYHYQSGKRIKGDMLNNPDLVLQQVEAYQKARQSLVRGALGITINALATGLAIPALANAMYGDEDDPVEKLFEEMGDNFFAKALFLKTIPVWGLADYYYHTKGKSEDEVLAAAETIGSVTGFGAEQGYGASFTKMKKYLASDKEETKQKGYAELGRVISNTFPKVPFYKQAKDVLQTADYFNSGVDPMRYYPTNFMQGLWGGGAIDDVMSMLPEEQQPEWYVQGRDKQEMKYIRKQEQKMME